VRRGIERSQTTRSDGYKPTSENRQWKGFDIIEISSGFITIPSDDWLRLVEKVWKAVLKVKPEVGMQFGAGGATASGEFHARWSSGQNSARASSSFC